MLGKFFNQEAQKLLDMDDIKSEAIRRVEESGIVFIDEIDKIASPGERTPMVLMFPEGEFNVTYYRS